MKKIIGLDIGTSNIKGEVYDLSGNLIESLSFPYKIYFNKDNWAEQDASEWVFYSKKILNYFFEKYEDIKVVGLSTQGGTLVPVGFDDKPLRKAITWMDARGYKQREEVLKKFNNSDIYRITGWKPQSILPLVQIMWLKENESRIFNSTKKFMFVSDYLQMKLCNKCYMDYSNASITMLFDIREKQWSKKILDSISIRENQLSEVEKSDTIIGFFKNKELHKNSRKILCANSGHDQYCVSLSSDFTFENSILLSTGTTWAIFTNTNKPCFNDYYYSPGVHILPEKYGLLCTIPTGGTVFNWFLNNFFKSDMNRKNFLNEVKREEEDFLGIKNDCIFIPLFNGMFGPAWSEKIKGSFLNIGFETTTKSLFKAVLEGVSFQFRWIKESLESIGIKIKYIKLIGSAARSKLQCQILSDITGVPVIIPKDLKINYACRGAAMLAAVSGGLINNFNKAIQTFKEKEILVEPSEYNRTYFDEKYQTYREYIDRFLKD